MEHKKQTISFKKRLLTDEEIDYILSDIRKLTISPNKEIRDSILNHQLDYIIPELKSYPIYADVPFFNIIDKLKKQITEQFISTFSESGDMIGELAGQSIGQPITQCTLSNFHSTGIQNATTTTGIPKINEILNASDNPKHVNCTIYFKSTVQFKDISEVRLWANKNIKEITIGSLLIDYSIINDNDDFHEIDKSYYKTFQKFYKSSQYHLLNSTDSFIRLYFNIDKLWLHNVMFYKIANLIEEGFSDACCVWSPEYLGIMDIYVDLSQLEEDEYSSFFEKIVFPKVKNFKITKASGISDVFVRLGPDGYIIDTNGSNLDYIFSLDEIDDVKTITNNMNEIYKIFGIQATYEFLIQTIEEILAAEGTGVSKRHLTILASVMTHTGDLSSINRYGIQCQLSSTLSNSSFEQTLDNFLKASIIGSTDKTDDVSASIICGSVAKIGTNMCDVLMDLSQIV